MTTGTDSGSYFEFHYDADGTTTITVWVDDGSEPIPDEGAK